MEPATLSADERALLRGLAFAELFDRPLELDELPRWAWGARVEHLVSALRSLDARGLVVSDGAGALRLVRGDPHHPPLQGRDASERAALAAPLVERAQRFARAAARLPFVRGVFLVNSLALGTSRAGSDIDVLVVAAPGRIWTARLLVTLLAQLRGWRRHGRHVAGRVCLSFFLTEDALDLTWMRLPDDVYLAYWVTSARLLAGSLAPSALLDANLWAVEQLPGTTVVTASAAPAGRWQGRVEALLARTGTAWLIERLVRAALGGRTRRRAAALGLHAGAVVNDRVQKFHDRDRRSEFRDRWLERCRRLGVHSG